MAQTNYVLDVNILASSIITGKLHQLIKIAENNIFFYISEELLAELKEVLSRPKFRKYLSVSPQKYIEIINEFTTIVEKSYLLKAKPVNSPDPDDNYLFQLSTFTESVLVTGDKKLLHWKQSPVAVISYAMFLKLFSLGSTI